MRCPRRRALAALVLLVMGAAGCARVAARARASRADFFPLIPQSRWEYAVSRHAGDDRFRFIATVRDQDFVTADGRACRVVDERYGDIGERERSPVVYCSEGGFLHRVMSLEYRGDTLQDNGMRSGEVKFLPTDLGHAHAWEGRTNAYRLPDGSGFEVQQLHEVREHAEAVDVPAGRFEGCARVETTAVHTAIGSDRQPVGSSFIFYYSDWYAPGVGLVKTEQRNVRAEVLATIELVRYHIGPGASEQ